MKKLTGKKLEAAISKAFYKHADCVPIPMMAITKIYAAGQKAYESADTAEAAEAALEAAMAAVITTYAVAK